MAAKMETKVVENTEVGLDYWVAGQDVAQEMEGK